MPSNEEETSEQLAAPPRAFDKQRLGSQEQKFLSVHVSKGSSNAEIVAAIKDALDSTEVPYFEDKDYAFPPIPPSMSSGQNPPSGQDEASEGGAAGQDAASEDATCKHKGKEPPTRNHGIIILLQQEGRP